MNNALYSKNCESKQRRCKITITLNAEEVLNIVFTFDYECYMISRENMAALMTRSKSIFRSTSTTVGATILGSAKYHMFYFLYPPIN